MNIDASNIDALDFTKGNGLVAAIVQDAQTRAVLMLGYMSPEAVRETLARQRVVFFSRTRAKLWEKGETSGHSLELVSVRTDCDRDTLLIEARPRGPVCHTGTPTCFGDAAPAPGAAPALASPQPGFLGVLEGIIARRAQEAASEAAADSASYTVKLLRSGTKRIAQKVGEEGVETALAAVGGADRELLSESADLLFHLLVLLRSRELTLAQVIGELERRHPPASDARRSASAAS